MSDSITPRVLSAIRSSASGPLPEEIPMSASFVADLGFDSMGIVKLSVALEDELDRPILLDAWVGSCSDPRGLTVASLCDYLGRTVTHDLAV